MECKRQVELVLTLTTLSSFTAFGTIGYLTKWIEEDYHTSIEDTAGGLTSIGEMAYRVNEI